MRISVNPVRVHVSKLRIVAQPADLGDLTSLPPEQQQMMDMPDPEKVQTKRQRDRRIKKLQELIDQIQPQAQDPERGPEIQAVIDQLQQQMQNIQKINEIGGDYYNWLQGEPGQTNPADVNPQKWNPRKKWETPEEIPTGGEDATPWDQPPQAGPAAPTQPTTETPRFPPAKMTPPPKTIDTAKDVPLDLSQEQQGLDQAALEQKALDIDRFIDDVETRAGDLLTALKAPDAQIQGDPASYKRKLTQLVNYIDGEVARVKPIADSLLSQLGGGDQAAPKAPTENIDTTDFEKYFPEA
jgi:hypothetical protein